jgi:hypothetical protein
MSGGGKYVFLVGKRETSDLPVHVRACSWTRFLKLPF